MDIAHVINSIRIVKQIENPQFLPAYEKLIERSRILSNSLPLNDIINGLESLSKNIEYYPKSLENKKLELLSDAYSKLEATLSDNKRR